MRRLSRARRELWVAIRAEYESGASVAQLARTYPATEQHIRRVKRAEAWEKPAFRYPNLRPEHLGRGTEHFDQLDNVIVLAGRVRTHASKDPGRGADPNIGASDAQLVAAMKTLALQLLEDATAGRIKPGLNQSAADVALRVIVAASRAIDASRLVAGKVPGQPSSSNDDESAVQRVTIVRRTVASGESR